MPLGGQDVVTYLDRPDNSKVGRRGRSGQHIGIAGFEFFGVLAARNSEDAGVFGLYGYGSGGSSKANSFNNSISSKDVRGFSLRWRYRLCRYASIRFSRSSILIGMSTPFLSRNPPG